jgi:uncharacterized protein YbjQ (UPF0145 family)
MFLTTEPSLAGKNYNTLRIVFASVPLEGGNNMKMWPKQRETAIENVLGKLYANATSLGADVVIGVDLNTSIAGGWVSATVIGTAIKLI